MNLYELLKKLVKKGLKKENTPKTYRQIDCSCVDLLLWY